MAEIILVLVALGSISYLGYQARRDQQETILLYVHILEAREVLWREERADLLNRIQAGSLSEYRNLTEERSPPRSANPLRRAFADPDLVPME